MHRIDSSGTKVSLEAMGEESAGAGFSTDANFSLDEKVMLTE
ncbi:hypothetical protein [Polaromonas sp. DSR2-3-2]